MQQTIQVRYQTSAILSVEAGANGQTVAAAKLAAATLQPVLSIALNT